MRSPRPSFWTRAFRLLLTASSGTKYENLLHELKVREIDSTRQFEENMAQIGHPIKQEVEPALSHSIVSGMFSGMFEFIIHDVPKEEALRCVRQLHVFYTAGWRALMAEE